MELSAYPRPGSDNGRGLHWSATPYHPTEVDEWMARLKAMNIRWLKVLDDGGGSSIRLCGRLLDEGIMPVVRLYRLQPNPGHIGGTEEKTIRNLARIGARYIETNNEADLQVEWSIARPMNWLDVVVDNWLYDAGKCLDAGALPAVPALSVGRKDDIIKAIVDKGGKDALAAGAWLAIHNYNLNHPLDYPDDDVNQRGQPLTPADYAAEGDWAWDSVPLATINAWRWQDKNPGNTILDDVACFRAFEFLNDQCVNALGYSLPIISTEGGVVMGWRDDRRYPRIQPRLHQQMTVAMFSYMQESAPSYYFACCPWLIGNYELAHFSPGWESQAWFTNWWNQQFQLNGRLPTVDALIALPSLSRLEKQGPHHSTIQGDVVAMRGVGGLRVTLHSDGFSAAASSDVDGKFHFFGLAPATYTLQAGGLYKAGLQLDGTNTLALHELRPPLSSTPVLDWDRRLSDLRVTIAPAQASAGTVMWKLVSAHLLDNEQAGLSGAVYYDVLDEVGRPIAGQEVILSWPDGAGRKATEERESPAHSAEFPISAPFTSPDETGSYSAWVDGLPCDRVLGLGLPSGQAVGFVLVFQRAPAPGASGSVIEGTISGVARDKTVTLSLPDGSTLTAGADARGYYAFRDLAPGAYALDVAGQGSIGRDILLDGANLIVFDYALPGPTSILRGTLLGGKAGIEVMLRSSSGEERHTTVNEQGVYEFRLLAAGTYTITVAGQTISNLRLDGSNTVQAPAIDVRPRSSVIKGRAHSKKGTVVPGAALMLAGPEGPETRTRETKTGVDGSYEFAALLGGTYTLQSGDVRQMAVVDGVMSITLDLILPLPAEEKVIKLALLLGPASAMGTHVNLRLARRYVRAFAPTVTFRCEDAQRALHVLIVGDLQAVSGEDEERLRSAGCTVARVGGTPYAVEDGLERLLSAGTALPKGRSAVFLPRQRPGGN